MFKMKSLSNKGKKSIVTLLVCSLMCGLFMPSARALEPEMDDISHYVLSGSGTFEDPYILDNDNPYKTMFDEVMRNSVRASNPNVSTYSVFSASLTGGPRYAPSGGKWTYTSGGLDASADNRMVYKGITYSDHTRISVLMKGLNNLIILDHIKDALGDYLFGPALNNYLQSKGVPEDIADAAEDVFGFVYGKFTFAGNDKAILEAAAQSGGVMEVVYNTSYHGSWYQSSALASWDEYPNAYFPVGPYGNGSFVLY